MVRHFAYIHSATVKRDFTNSKKRNTKQKCLTTHKSQMQISNVDHKCPLKYPNALSHKFQQMGLQPLQIGAAPFLSLSKC